MKERTIEILLLFGIVLVSLGIVVLLGRRYMKHAASDMAKWMEAFQGVARGGAAPMYRGDYDRSVLTKVNIPDTSYKQTSYSPDRTALPTYTRETTQPNHFIKTIKIECASGSCDYINFSLIAVWSNGVNVALWSEGANQDGSNGCGGSWCGDVMETKNYGAAKGWPNLYHSTNSGTPVFQLNLKYGYIIDKIDINNRADCCQNRLSGYNLRLYDTGGTLRHTFRLTSALQQSYTVAQDCPANYSFLGTKYTSAVCYKNCNAGESLWNSSLSCIGSCPAGFVDTGNRTNLAIACRRSCAAGEIEQDLGAFFGVTCWRACNAGTRLEGGAGGTCRMNSPGADYRLVGNTYYQDCKPPQKERDSTTCYTACAAGEDDSKPSKCYRPCPSGYILRDTRYDPNTPDCFPTDPYTYLPIAWLGPVISQAETTRNMGLTLSLGAYNGSPIGLWGSISESAGSTNYTSDQLWAYTEDMQLVNLAMRKCMDAGGAAPCIWDCGTQPWQKWVLDSEGRIRQKNDLSKCLTVTDWSPRTTGDPIVELTINKKVSLQPCTNDGNKFQRWIFPARAGINQSVDAAAAPPALPSEPLNRDGFTDGGDSGSSRESRGDNADNAFKE